VALLQQKATADEVDGYRRFVMSLASKVAAAHREGGESESAPETQAIQDIEGALGAPNSTS
jgi:hypothetical protein